MKCSKYLKLLLMLSSGLILANDTDMVSQMQHKLSKLSENVVLDLEKECKQSSESNACAIIDCRNGDKSSCIKAQQKSMEQAEQIGNKMLKEMNPEDRKKVEGLSKSCQKGEKQKCKELEEFMKEYVTKSFKK